MASLSDKTEVSEKPTLNIKNADLVKLLTTVFGIKVSKEDESQNEESTLSQQNMENLLQSTLNQNPTSCTFQMPSSNPTTQIPISSLSMPTNVVNSLQLNSSTNNIFQIANPTEMTQSISTNGEQSSKNIVPLSLFSPAVILPTQLLGTTNSNTTQPLFIFNPAQMQQQQQPILIPIGHMLPQNIVLNQENINKLLQLQQQPLQQQLKEQQTFKQIQNHPKKRQTLSDKLKQQSMSQTPQKYEPNTQVESLITKHKAFPNKLSSSLTQQTNDRLIKKICKVKFKSDDVNLEGRISVPEPDENIGLEDLELYAKYFKKRRIELGYTQGDVGAAMGRMYGNDFSQTTISRFEALNLSFKNMCKLKPLLQLWLVDADQRESTLDEDGREDSSTSSRKRKKRTIIDTAVRVTLERMFSINSKPSSDDLTQFADKMNMEKEVIRVWFCNRRQKEKRINPPSNFSLQNNCLLSQQTVQAVSSSDVINNSYLNNFDSLTTASTYADQTGELSVTSENNNTCLVNSNDIPNNFEGKIENVASTCKGEKIEESNNQLPISSNSN